MPRVISIREHGRLTTAPVVHDTLDLARVGEADFDWLVTVSAKLSRIGARLIEVDGRRTLSVDNYVGVVELPSGTHLEIVPKNTGVGDDLGKSRSLVLKLIAGAMDISPRTITEANLQTMEYPISEWLVWQYLTRLDTLLKRGIRFEYQRIEEEIRYLRGQLNIAKQIRQPIDRQHLFPVRHDVFTPDRAENRLIRLALNICDRVARSPDARRLVNILAGFLRELRPSVDLEADLNCWSNTRLLTDYRLVKPWCELIVRGMNPISQLGTWLGSSMLFPMEKLFERYVAARLERVLAPGCRMRTQRREHALCTHLQKPWFELRPDMMIDAPSGVFVLDAKWKLLDTKSSSRSEKYGLKESDFYQLFAYGERYLNGRGQMYIIYPASKEFAGPLEPFHFSEALQLWILPFDLRTDSLLPGRWMESATWLKQVGLHEAGIHLWA